jgi:hypothetical protein
MFFLEKRLKVLHQPRTSIYHQSKLESPLKILFHNLYREIEDGITIMIYDDAPKIF